MKKTRSITENKDFKRLYFRGERFNSPLVVLYVLRNDKLGGNVGNKNFKRDKLTLSSTNFLGLTVSNKVGKAVRRNKVRRWFREIYMYYESRLPAGYSMIILAKIGAAESNYWELKRQIKVLLKKAKLI